MELYNNRYFDNLILKPFLKYNTINLLRIFKIFFEVVILLQLFISVSYCQNINIYQENSNSFQFDIKKIWNVSIVNLTSPLDVYLIGTIESVDSKLLFKAQTSDFKLQSGTRKVSFSSINLVNTKEYSNYLSKDKNGKSTLPHTFISGIFSSRKGY